MSYRTTPAFERQDLNALRYAGERLLMAHDKRMNDHRPQYRYGADFGALLGVAEALRIGNRSKPHAVNCHARIGGECGCGAENGKA